MTIEMIILIVITTFVAFGPDGESGIFKTPLNTFKEAGSYLGGRIERQLDTAAGFQEKALDTANPGNRLNWSK